MKRTLSLLLALWLVLSMLVLFACGDPAPSVDPDGQGEDDPAQDAVEEILILGESSDFVVVRAEYATDAEKSAMTRLLSAIREVTGSVPRTQTDYVDRDAEVPNDTHEILIGMTNRQASIDADAALAPSSYSITFDGTKLVILAENEVGYEKALDYFIVNYIASSGGVLKLKKGFSVSNEYSISAKELLQNLDTLTEAKGADSGEQGNLYLLEAGTIAPKAAYDANDYDMLKFLVSLQGLENRDDATIFVNEDKAQRWLTYFRAQTTGLLYGKKIVNVSSFETLLEVLGDKISAYGIVVWDPDAPYTSNIATTVCGVEGYLPVMYSTDASSLYQKLIKKYGEDLVKMDLCGKFTGEAGTKIWDTDAISVGSAKCDAYLWAMEKYVKTDKTSKEYIAYMTDAFPVSPNGGGNYLDNSVYETYLPSQDYIVANAIFTFDVSMLKDELPIDDPTQPMGADYEIMCTLARYQYDRNDGAISRCIGFPPFPYKYAGTVGGKNDPTMTEWLTVEIMSAYNIAVEADCPGPSSLYNCSVYCQYEPQIEWDQSEKREAALNDLPDYEDDTYYLYIYMGDYDAASWTYHSGSTFAWDNEDRGELPLAWAFNPNLSERVPMLWDYFYATATENDVFIAGDSGAGYVNSVLLQEGKRKHSDLPDALDAWSEWCQYWYNLTDITITGMLLDGNNGYAPKNVLEVVAAFSPDGIGVWNWPGNDSGTTLVDGVAVSGMAQSWNIGSRGEDPAVTGQALVNIINTRRPNGLRFYPIKCNLNYPSDVVNAVEAAQALLDAEGEGKRIEVVDAYTYFAMIARELE